MHVSNFHPQVGLIMGSKSDWATLQHTAAQLEHFGITFEKRIVSAHRTPQLLVDYAHNAAERGLHLIIAGAGGAAHLPGMVAAITRLPVIGVPVASKHLQGLDSLLSIVQMPGGIPVATVAIGEAGAKNAGILAASILALHDEAIRQRLELFRREQTQNVLSQSLEET